MPSWSTRGCASFALAVTSVTMALTPLVVLRGAALRRAAADARARAVGTDGAAEHRPEACDRRRLRPRRQSGVHASERARHSLYRRRFRRFDGDARSPRRSGRLLWRRGGYDISRNLRPGQRRRRHHHHPRPRSDRRGRRPCARHAPRCAHRLARPRCRSCAPSLSARRHRRGARNRRSEPAAFGSGAGRARNSGRSGDRLDPRKARRDPPCLAGRRARKPDWRKFIRCGRKRRCSVAEIRASPDTAPAPQGFADYAPARTDRHRAAPPACRAPAGNNRASRSAD